MHFLFFYVMVIYISMFRQKSAIFKGGFSVKMTTALKRLKRKIVLDYYFYFIYEWKVQL
jgi:hypothetical protein